jgi:DNA-binding beta-propeller fold protein YncE
MWTWYKRCNYLYLSSLLKRKFSFLAGGVLVKKKMTFILRLMIVVFLLGTLLSCSDSSSSTSTSPSLSIQTPVRLSGSSETVLISDYDNRSILKMRLSDQALVGEINISGKPTGLAQTSTEVFVGNESRGNVEVYGLDSGQYLRKMGETNRLFTLPNGIAVDESAGLVFIVDTTAKAVKQFLLDGSSAGPDFGVGALTNPTALTIDKTNQWLYVSDFGEPISSFGDTPAIHIIAYGTAAPSVSRIEGVSFDFDRPQGLFLHNNKLFVAESVAGKVLVFDVSDLASVSQLPAIGAGELKMPLDVFIDVLTGDLYVTSSLNAEVVIFAGGGA